MAKVKEGSTKITILITGASSGIGAATARLFGEEGYCVVLAARRLEPMQAIAKEIAAGGGDALALQADISRLEGIHKLVEEVQSRYKSIDILFNNAGFGRMGWLEQLDPEQDIQAQIQVNLSGLIRMTQAVLPGMIQHRAGHIINMASMAGIIATPTYTIYAASKFGVRGFSEALRREVSAHGINVSVLYPGGVSNEFSDKARIKRKTGVTTPSWLRLSNEDVAHSVLGLVIKPRRSLVIPWPLRLAGWANILFPGILDWGIERYFVRRELE